MDALAIVNKVGSFVGNMVHKRETFLNLNDQDSISFPSASTSYPQDRMYNTPRITGYSIAWTIISLVIGILVGIFAAYLSWQCNAKLEYHMGFRVIFAIFAYLFGLIYIILYYTMRWDVCREI
jgi:hypothetical protein